MPTVGRLYGMETEPGRFEWRRVVSLKPLTYGALLMVTKDKDFPGRYLIVDWSIVCPECNGAGKHPPKTVCPKCGGDGRKTRLVSRPQKPFLRPPFLGIYELR